MNAVVIEESKIGNINPWYAFIPLWRLITYFYPLLLQYNKTTKYLNRGGSGVLISVIQSHLQPNFEW
jgi:hypothetical protein